MIESNNIADNSIIIDNNHTTYNKMDGLIEKKLTEN